MKPAVSRYLAILSEHRARLCSILSPGEIAVYQAYGEKRVNAENARLKGEIEKQKFALQTLAAHERAKLSNNMLTNYCRPETLRNGRTYVAWPSYGLLLGIGERVEKYLFFTSARVKRQRLRWKAFELLGKRLPAVQLVEQVNELAKRALARLTEDKARVHDARPLTVWLSLIGYPAAWRLLAFDSVARDVVKKIERRREKERTQREREKERRRQQKRRVRIAGFA